MFRINRNLINKIFKIKINKANKFNKNAKISSINKINEINSKSIINYNKNLLINFSNTFNNHSNKIFLFGTLFGTFFISYVYAESINDDDKYEFQTYLVNEISNIRKENWDNDEPYPKITLLYSDNNIATITIDVTSIQDPLSLFEQLRLNYNIKLSLSEGDNGIYNCDHYSIQYNNDRENNKRSIIITFSLDDKDDATTVVKNIYKTTLIESTKFLRLQIIKELKTYGVEVVIPKENTNKNKLSWNNFVGYDDVKETIIDSIILPLKHPEIYEKISADTHEMYFIYKLVMKIEKQHQYYLKVHQEQVKQHVQEFYHLQVKFH